MKKATLWLTVAAAATILLGIAISQILLAVALGTLLLSGLPLKWPKITWPLAGFLAWTLLALAFSPDPGDGQAQIRKFIVFLYLLIVYSGITRVAQAKFLTFIWMAIGTVTAGRGLIQFIRDVIRWKGTSGSQDFYHFYIADRIVGFMGHWMTFSGQELFVLLLLLAFLLFAPDVRKRLWLVLPGIAIVGLALILSDTRGVWIAAVVAAVYLVWCSNRWAALALPILLGLGLLVAPAIVKERVDSLLHPHGQTDSNAHRIIVWRTGWQMIKAHPLLGVGPDEIIKDRVFFAYLPKDIPRPLPEGYYGHLHNFYIQYAAERGIPATLFITGALIMALVDFTRALRRLPPGRSDRRFLLQAAIATIIGTMVGGIFEYNLNDSEVLTMFLAIMCLGYLARATSEPPRDASQTPPDPAAAVPA